MTQIARRVGWKGRRRLKVIDAKAPLPADIAYGDYGWDDVCDYVCDYGWYGCGEDGCCINTDWAVAVMPPMMFSMDGLVHVTRPREPIALCGAAGNWPDPPVQSTDEAIAYAESFGRDFRQVTCLICVSRAPQCCVAWSAA